MGCSCPSPGCEPTDEVKARRNPAHIPDGLDFHTKPRIAGKPVRDVVVLGPVQLDWIVADDEYG
jgi:hypothetical protein